MSPYRWVLLTGEYPPQPGGVSDYTRLVARGLADAGDDVHVWASMPRGQPALLDPGVKVHRLAGTFGPRDLETLDRFLTRLRSPCRVLVQYVPQAFGWRGLNVPFCLWLARRPEILWIMFHEVAFPLSRGQPLTHNALGVVNRLMAGLVALRADRIFVSIPSWKAILSRSCRVRRPISWLPVPSNISTSVPARAVAELREKLAPADTTLIGHFGTYGHHVASLLGPAITLLLGRNCQQRALLLGRGSDGFAAGLAKAEPALRARINATGPLDADQLAAYLAACDCLLQPYIDGVSSRRTSVMAGLALRLPIVTNAGSLTESVWKETNAVVLARSGAPEHLAQAVEALMADPKQRLTVRQRAAEVYESCFSLARTIQALRTETGRAA